MDNIEKTNDALLYNPKIHLDHSSTPQDWKNDIRVCFPFLFSSLLLFHIFWLDLTSYSFSSPQSIFCRQKGTMCITQSSLPYKSYSYLGHLFQGIHYAVLSDTRMQHSTGHPGVQTGLRCIHQSAVSSPSDFHQKRWDPLRATGKIHASEDNHHYDTDW